VTPETAAGEQSLLPATIAVDGAQLPTWPDGQSVVPMSAQLMALTNFNDHAGYHPALIRAVLAAEQDSRFRDTIFKGGCGIKVRNIPGWDAPAAALIHARALLLAHHTVTRRPVFADDTWASVYRAGDFCMPHSHLRSNLSIVYMLDPGDQDATDPLAGQLCFADPRIDACCPHEPGRVTQHVLPIMNSGAMLIFASDYLHSVNPYTGGRPRITLSWNITLEKLPGRAGEGWKT
jgi:hypothetical protein